MLIERKITDGEPLHNPHDTNVFRLKITKSLFYACQTLDTDLRAFWGVPDPNIHVKGLEVKSWLDGTFHDQLYTKADVPNHEFFFTVILEVLRFYIQKRPATVRVKVSYLPDKNYLKKLTSGVLPRFSVSISISPTRVKYTFQPRQLLNIFTHFLHYMSRTPSVCCRDAASTAR